MGVLTGVRIFVSEGVSVALMLGISAVIVLEADGSSDTVFDIDTEVEGVFDDVWEREGCVELRDCDPLNVTETSSVGEPVTESVGENDTDVDFEMVMENV